MALFEKIKDWLMPPTDEYEDEYEEEAEKPKEQKAAKVETLTSVSERSEQVAVNGGSANVFASASRFADNTQSVRHFSQESGIAERPKFKLHTASNPSLNMEVHVPQNFDQVKVIGDQLKQKNAVIVNYEMLAVHDQRRICDFLNGLTYVLDGSVKRISNQIVLYVPDGVNVSDATLAVA